MTSRGSTHATIVSLNSASSILKLGQLDHIRYGSVPFSETTEPTWTRAATERNWSIINIIGNTNVAAVKKDWCPDDYWHFEKNNHECGFNFELVLKQFLLKMFRSSGRKRDVFQLFHRKSDERMVMCFPRFKLPWRMCRRQQQHVKEWLNRSARTGTSVTARSGESWRTRVGPGRKNVPAITSAGGRMTITELTNGHPVSSPSPVGLVCPSVSKHLQLVSSTNWISKITT